MKRLIFKCIRFIVLLILKIFHKILKVDSIYYNSLYDMTDIHKEVSHCLILGAKLFDDDSIPPILKERLDAAIRLYEHNPQTIFILSGDGSKRISNDVDAMQKYLLHASSIPKEQMVLDPAGYTTYDSIANYIRDFGSHPLVVLTSAFHLPRSLYICHALKVKAYGIFLPPSNPKAQTAYRNRELAALVKSWYRVHFHTPRLMRCACHLRFFVALVTEKILFCGLRLLRKGASTYPGRIMLKFCPDAFTYLTKNISLILVTGTNGKTSTCRLLQHVLRSQNISCISNTSGANLRFGLATTLATHCSLMGHYKASYAVLECDEGDFAKIARQFTSKQITVLVTNLSHDQLDRYGDLHRIQEFVLCGIESIPHATVCLNKDCALTASLALHLPNPVHFFEVCQTQDICNTLSSDGYSLNIEKDGTLSLQAKTEPIPCGPMDSSTPAYVLYNRLAAAVILHSLGYPQMVPLCFSETFNNPGRFETISIGNTQYTMILIKNPAGCQQALQSLPQDTRNCDIVFTINDSISDGQDISWLWNCDFSLLLSCAEDTAFYCTGTRYASMAVRLKYQGLDVGRLILQPDLNELFRSLQHSGRHVYLFTTYSGMQTLRHHLEGLSH